MSQTIYINQKPYLLSDSGYIASGGLGAVYKIGNQAAKIYHDMAKVIPIGKVKELFNITHKKVIKPNALIYNKNGKEIGFSMDLIEKTEPLCKFFTKSFKKDNKISIKDITALCKEMQEIVAAIHLDKFLIVDLNEMNVLIKNKGSFFIDVDSYQTPSYPATAIMDSIRDPKKSPQGGEFWEGSDWFSFAVLACQIFINIHPYKGSCPGYKIKDWPERMKLGISIFDPKVSLPPAANDLNVLPKSYRVWMEGIFSHKDRSAPPPPDSILPIKQNANISLISQKYSSKFIKNEICAFDSDIKHLYNFYGAEYVVTEKSVYKNNSKVDSISSDVKLACCDGNIIYGMDKKGNFSINYKEELDFLPYSGAFCLNNSFYVHQGNKLLEVSFVEMNNRIFPRVKEIENLSVLSSHVFDGCVIQDLLGKKWLSIPLELGMCLTKPIAELDGHRILEAKYQDNFCLIMAEKGGKYDLFVIEVKKQEFLVSRMEDVTYDKLNFAVKDGKMAILANSNNDVFIFGGQKSFKYENSPLDSSMRLFYSNGKVKFAANNTLLNLKLL